ncbi:MAG: hypothetical protein IPM02_06035 [Betaproteobacteria bacterium]|nr:hypothetical protein [Betaproteobacteria bacterium]
MDELMRAIDAAHAACDGTREASRAAVVRDIVARLVLDETRIRLDAILGSLDAGDWRAQRDEALKFIAGLPSPTH